MKKNKSSYLGTIACLLFIYGGYSQSKLNNITAITPDGEYNNPVWSPDGEKLLVTDHHNDALYIIYLEDNKKIEKIKSGQGIGYKANWSSDSKKVIFQEKLIDGTFSNSQVKSLDISTHNETILPKEYLYDSKANLNNKSSNTLFIYINQETLKLEAKEGINGTPWIITSEDGQFYHPVVSPDKKKVIVHEGPNMYEYSIYNKIERKDLGIGLASDWLPDNSGIISFEDKSMDGHEISSSDLFLISEKSSKKIQLTYSKNTIETWSKISPDGKKIAYADEKSGKIFLADLNLKN